MSHNLYTEAIAEAKQLRELAELNARNKIIEAVTPRIRSLIEKQLMDDLPDADEDADDSIDDESDDVVAVDMTDSSVDTDNAVKDVISNLSQSSNNLSTNNQQTTDVSMSKDGHITLKVGGVNIDVTDTAGKSMDNVDDFMNDGKLMEAIRIMAFQNHKKIPYSKQVKLLEMNLSYLKLQIESAHNKGKLHANKGKFRKMFESLARQAVSLRGSVILTEQDSRVKQKISYIIKEMNNMSRKNSRNIFNFLFEGDEEDQVPKKEKDSDLKEQDDCEDKERVAEGLYEADDENMLTDEDLGDDLDEEPVDSDVDSQEDLSKVRDLLQQAIDALPQDEEEVEDDLPEDKSESDGEDEDVKKEGAMFEIDEAILRRELRKMKKLSEATSGVSDPKLSARAFGGGDVEDEMFVDVDEETLLNALIDELGNVKFKGGKMNVAAEARNRRAGRLTESHEIRALRGQLAEYKKATAALKDQLVEMNLFNAKLLYANKLMQNKNLTQSQQKAIVEALDSAKTLDEAKLLYKSLTASLNKSKSSSLREGATRTLGSASRSTPSAQKLTSNGVEVDRWAILAGIAGNK